MPALQTSTRQKTYLDWFLPWCVALPLICLLSFGTYFCLDYPGSIGSSPAEEICCLYEIGAVSGTACGDIEPLAAANKNTGNLSGRVYCEGLFIPEKKPGLKTCVASKGKEVTTQRCIAPDAHRSAEEVCMQDHNGTSTNDETIMRRFNLHNTTNSTFWDQYYTGAMNSALYSVYNFENVLLATVGGVVIDQIGLRKAVLLFLLLVNTGQALFATGVTMRMYWLIVVGRAVFGFGGESLSVAQPTFCARFFTRNGRVATAFSITMTFARIGSALIFFIMPILVEKSVILAVWSGCGTCIVSLVAILLLSIVDYTAEKKDLIEPIGGGKKARDEDALVNSSEGAGCECDDDEGGLAGFIASAKEVLVNPCFLLQVYVCITAYCCVFPFNGVAKVTFEAKNKVGQSTADLYVMMYVLASGLSAPICGYLIEGIGYSLVWLLLACTTLGTVHLLLWKECVPPILLMCVFGVAVSLLAASLWPGVAKVVSPNRVGTAYGIMTGLQNLGLGTTFLVAGSMQSNVALTCTVFSSLGYFSALGPLALIFVDLATGRRLNRAGQWLDKDAPPPISAGSEARLIRSLGAMQQTDRRLHNQHRDMTRALGGDREENDPLLR